MTGRGALAISHADFADSADTKTIGTADIFRGFMIGLYVKGKENSYYVCNREPTEVLIDTLWSLDFFALRDAMNLSASLREPSHLSMR